MLSVHPLDENEGGTTCKRPLGMLFYIKGGNHMEYKDTLLMPNTAFEMRGKLPSKEPNIQKRWQQEQL